jgi:hypothetical protein
MNRSTHFSSIEPDRVYHHYSTFVIDSLALHHHLYLLVLAMVWITSGVLRIQLRINDTHESAPISPFVALSDLPAG